MKEKILLILKGFIFGIANIIPGVSGGTIALTMGVYEDLITSISNILSSFKKSMSILIPFFFGTVLAILSMSKVINYTLDKYPTQTILFFVGLILGGIPLIYKHLNIKKNKKIKKTNMALCIVTFIFVIVLALLGGGSGNYDISNPNIITMILLFLVGAVAAASMVIPGISGSFVLMLLGFYKPIIGVVSDLTSINHLVHNLMILIPFGLGVVIGIVLIAKLLEYLFNKYPLQTYFAIFGFIIASVITLLMTIKSVSVSEIIVGLILLVIGGVIGYKLGDE